MLKKIIFFISIIATVSFSKDLCTYYFENLESLNQYAVITKIKDCQLLVRNDTIEIEFDKKDVLLPEAWTNVTQAKVSHNLSDSLELIMPSNLWEESVEKPYWAPVSKSTQYYTSNKRRLQRERESE
jgi:hypothetical protein